MEHKVKLSDGSTVPALGQGTWYLGESRAARGAEKEALLAGIENGMTLIDTAEMYGSGLAEELVGEVLKEVRREEIFIVSKVYPHNAGRKNIFKSCMASMDRMGVDYIDLYLLHWRGGVPLSETVECMEQLKKEGKIRSWGVSNFDTDDMEELFSVPNGKNCAVNQVLYHVASRGVEYSLLPWLKEHGVAMMAYCPLAQKGDLKRGLFDNPVLKSIAGKHGVSIGNVLLSWVIREPGVIAIPRTGVKAHAIDNAAADRLILDREDIANIDAEFPAPTRKMHLDMQ